MKNILISIVIGILLAGCINNLIVVDPIRSWEGHYMTTDEVKAVIEQIELQDNESVWILSDKTLNRVIKNIQTGN